MNLDDLRWLAGLLEGEGSFGWHGKGPGSSLIIALGMTDEDVMRRAGLVFGTETKIYGPYGPYHYQKSHRGVKPIYRLHVLGKTAAGWMMTLYPLMGERRKDQIKRALGVWKNKETRSSWVKRGWVTRRAGQFALTLS